MKKKILTIGEIVVDETVVLDHELISGEKIKSKGVFYSIGGPAAAAAIFYQKMGHEVTLVSSLAKDKEGYWLREKFRRKKINLFVNFQSKTQKNIVLVEKKNQRRTIIRDCFSSKPVVIEKKLIKEADLIYLDRHQTHLFEEIQANKKKETEIIFDPSTDASFKNLLILKQINYPIIPYEFVFNWQEKKEIKEGFKQLVNFLKKPVIVTLGPWGSVFLTKFSWEYFPSYQVKLVDVSGAGDIFRAAFGETLLNHCLVDRAIDFANRVAALSCTRFGNSESIPSKKEIKNFSFEKNYYQLEDFFNSLSNKIYD